MSPVFIPISAFTNVGPNYKGPKVANFLVVQITTCMKHRTKWIAVLHTCAGKILGPVKIR